MKTLTTIYSSPSIDALKELFQCLSDNFFCEPIDLDDAFCYGVFCKPETYANFAQVATEIPNDVEFPSELTSPCSTPEERLDYVNGIIQELMCGAEEEWKPSHIVGPCGEIIEEDETPPLTEKPEWMLYVEEDINHDLCVSPPSTFLYLIPKSEEYEELGQLLINFLYSPNAFITMLE